MNEMLLQEYVDRRGMVTPEELIEQTGAAPGLWRKPAVALIAKREIFLCRLAQGRQTLLSRHLLLCLGTVYTEPSLSAGAQELMDWLSDNARATVSDMRQNAGVGSVVFEAAFLELQQKLCAAPIEAVGNYEDMPETPGDDFLAGIDFLWMTVEDWLDGLRRPNKYRDLEYCLSEIRRLMKKYFSTRELNNLIYHGTL